jgi:hypothetical protein
MMFNKDDGKYCQYNIKLAWLHASFY